MPEYDYKLYQGDCLEVLRKAPSDRCDSVVCDPPYGLSNKKPDMNEVLTHWMNGDDYKHRGSGFMSMRWDSFVPGPQTWKEVLRVLKPGGMALVFSGTRMSDLMGISLRLAGFEIIDTIHWSYGCLSEDTEILTPGGWRGYKDIKGETVLGFDKDRNELRWQPVQETFVYDYNETAYRIHSENTDQIVSKNHRVLVSGEDGLDFEYAENLADKKQIQAPVIKSEYELLNKVYSEGVLKPAASNHVSYDLARIEPIFYEGVVWCVSVPSTAFVARRNGKVFVTGNSGFPKATDISKQIDKKYGAEREVVGENPNHRSVSGVNYEGIYAGGNTGAKDITAPTTDEAKKWEGWKTPSLKPAHEHILMVRKPFRGSATDNVLKWGTGAINVDASRIGYSNNDDSRVGKGYEHNAKAGLENGSHKDNASGESQQLHNNSGRYPSNFLLTHSPDCEYIGEKKVKGSPPGVNKVKPYGSERTMGVSSTPPQETTHYADKDGNETVAEWSCVENCPVKLLDSGDNDNPSRFFKQCNYSDIDYDIIKYQAKASKSERVRGLENQEIIELEGEVWGIEVQKVKLRVVMEQSRPKVIDECGTNTLSVTDWNTILFGSERMDQSQMDIQYTIETVTNSTMNSQTLKWLMPSHIKEYMEGVGGMVKNGGSLVEIVKNNTPQITITKEKTESPLGVENVASKMQLTIKGNAGSPANHPTCKPIALLEYLITLITPPGGVCLDPFAGSGSTGVAAINNGFKPIMIEMEPEYVEIIQSRIDDALSKRNGTEEEAR